MAGIHLNRLVNSLGLKPDEITGMNYQKLVGLIVGKNTQYIATGVTRISKKRWGDYLQRITPKGKRFILPDISTVLPQNHVFMRKSAESGKMITDTLHHSLTGNLRDILSEFSEKTGQPSYIIRRGRTAGRINRGLIEAFGESIRGTFEGYRKRDPKTGIPGNIHQIAVTEVRSTINEIKHTYVTELMSNNEGLKGRKAWIHNPRLSFQGRKGHISISAQTMRRPILIDQAFEVKRYIPVRGKMVLIGITKMTHPHDPTAPLDQFIGCNCDVDYRLTWR